MFYDFRSCGTRCSWTQSGVQIAILNGMVWLLVLLVAAPLLVFAAHLSAVAIRCMELDERLERLLQKAQVKA